MSENKVRTIWDRPKSRIDFSDAERITKQSFKEESDINTIVARWLKTGIPPSAIADNMERARYMDFDNVDDYLDMQERVASVNSNFELLPADIRTMFNNEASELIEFLSDPANQAAAAELGFADPPSTPAPEQPPAGHREAEPTDTPEPAPESSPPE